MLGASFRLPKLTSDHDPFP